MIGMLEVKAVCFDLDGTLLDTLEEIGVSANTVLKRLGYPPHEINAYRSFVGDGIRCLVERMIPRESLSDDRVLEVATMLEKEYHRRANRCTRVYPGIMELLDRLEERSIPKAVLSNKPHELTLACIQRFFPQHSFSVVLGQRPGHPRKPDPAGAFEIASQLGVDPGSVLYVGDTDVDMQTAKAAGMIAVGVLWGFRRREELEGHGAEFVVAHPLEILDRVNVPQA